MCQAPEKGKNISVKNAELTADTHPLKPLFRFVSVSLIELGPLQVISHFKQPPQSCEGSAA